MLWLCGLHVNVNVNRNVSRFRAESKATLVLHLASYVPLMLVSRFCAKAKLGGMERQASAMPTSTHALRVPVPCGAARWSHCWGHRIVRAPSMSRPVRYPTLADRRPGAWAFPVVCAAGPLPPPRVLGRVGCAGGRL
jgi:hypothetical protein